METKNTHVMYGLISGVAMVAIIIAMHFGKVQNPYIAFIAYAPFVVGILLNAVAFSKANDGYVTFNNVFGSGFKASMIVAIVTLTWTVISLYAFPEIKERAIETSRASMSSMPNMTDESIDQAIQITKKFYGTALVSGIILVCLSLGAVLSLIGGGIATKKGERPMTSDSY